MATGTCVAALSTKKITILKNMDMRPVIMPMAVGSMDITECLVTKRCALRNVGANWQTVIIFE